MADKRKKTYTKPQLKSQKIELGVYGNYDGGDTTLPVLPVRDREFPGGSNLGS